MTNSSTLEAEVELATHSILQAIDVEVTKRVEKNLSWWAGDIARRFIPKCSQCKRRATEQTLKGKEAQKNLHRPVNWSYYCKKHADEGRELEREAMYG